jgi:succinate dehydrogenase/fumarate reductase-like Fe-S protein
MAATLKVSLWRGGTHGRYVDYDVPMRQNQTVLDIVTWVQRNLDSTLSYRFACRVGMCGSCAMTVNGRPRWTCRTHVSKVVAGGRLRIGPLENLPVIKDLATDMQQFFEKWQRAQGRFAPFGGTPSISGRRRSIARGHWSTTYAMPATSSGLPQSRRTAAVTPAIRISLARSTVRWRSTRRPRSRD